MICGRERPCLPEILGQADSRWSEIADFKSVFTRSASAVAPRKKVQLTQIESQLRAFQ